MRRPTQRRLGIEQLSSRLLLAADLLPTEGRSISDADHLLTEIATLRSDAIPPARIPPARIPPARMDGNGDRRISPIDALLVINALNDEQADLSDQSAIAADINLDGHHSPIDALLVINMINAQNEGTVLELSRTDADFNTQLIESHVQYGLSVLIPAGIWPVRPITMHSHSSLRGISKNESELRLTLDHDPLHGDAQHVIATAPVTPGGFVSDIRITDLTINANYKKIDWSNVYNDGNAHGLNLQAVENSTFERLEIKNAYTDGIYLSTVLGYDNNPRHCTFDNITIHHAGRQGVSIVGGEQITMTRFEVSDIGRDINLDTSPRSAIDLEPEPNAKRFVRDITIRDWKIHRVGQGILATGAGSSKPMKNIIIEDIMMTDLDGPQVLAVREVTGLRVNNVHARGHHAIAGGVSAIFHDTIGEVYALKIREISGVNYPIQAKGDSDLRLRNIVIDGTEEGFLQIGSDPDQIPRRTKVHLASFEFHNYTDTGSSIVPVRVNSVAEVSLRDGKAKGIENALFTMELSTDATFHNCDFDKGALKFFVGLADGEAFGEGNSWQVNE